MTGKTPEEDLKSPKKHRNKIQNHRKNIGIRSEIFEENTGIRSKITEKPVE